jgi:hypothetical protein
MIRARTLPIASRLLLLPVLLAGARGVSAQERCSSSEAIGWIGISGLTCSNCEFAYPGPGRNRFGTEPRIAAVASNSPAASTLRAGDILVGIDDHLITTGAAGQRLSSLKPGEAVWVEVRRNGELLRYRFANLPAICPSDARVINDRIRAGAVAAGRAGSGRFSRSISERAATSSRVFTPGLLPRASFGFGISCSRCSARQQNDGTLAWEFSEFPEIYSVDAQSRAYRAGVRRGDVITRIDDLDITSAEGGRRFGQVQPGQQVRFTFRRGSTTMARELLAEERSAGVYRGQLASARALESENSLREMRELVEQIRQQQTRERRQIDQLRRNDEQSTRELADQLLRQREDQLSRLQQLYTELQRIEQARGETLSARPAIVGSASGGRNMIRYSGKMGDAEVEVRGPPFVNIVETPDEIIITSGDSTIRIRRTGR